jgi:hypothetical protein
LHLKYLLSALAIVSLFFDSCTSQGSQLKFHYPVDSIQLLVADTAVFGYNNWQEHQYTNQVISVAGSEVGFIDLTGKWAHQPMQVVSSFSFDEQQRLLASFELLGDDAPPPTTCVHFYRHVFQCFYAGKRVGQISLDVSCKSIYIEPDNKMYDVTNERIYNKLLSILKNNGVYLYGGGL